ncbi:unnamed protein product, partial [Ascophyllum nodosum]
EKVQPSASAGGCGGAAGSGGARAHQHRKPASQPKQASRDSFPNQPSPHSSGRQRRRGPSSVRKMLLLQLPILQDPHWYSVAKDMALMQSSFAFMERVFSIIRACMDERQESSYSDRIAASALLKYIRGRGKQ